MKEDVRLLAGLVKRCVRILDGLGERCALWQNIGHFGSIYFIRYPNTSRAIF